MCSAILAAERYLVFAGLLLATSAAFWLVVRVSALFEWMVRAQVYWTFKSLHDRIDRQYRLIGKTAIPAMLEGSTVVGDRLRTIRRYGMWALGTTTKTLLHRHDRLRATFGLPPRRILYPNDLFDRFSVEASHHEVRERIMPYLDSHDLSESRWLKFWATVFLAGSALQLLANLPVC